MSFVAFFVKTHIIHALAETTSEAYSNNPNALNDDKSVRVEICMIKYWW